MVACAPYSPSAGRSGAKPQGPSSLQLGEGSSSIVGGEETREGSPEAKSTVNIMLRDPSNPSKIKQHCTGTLISKQLVLTAGHCIVTTNANLYRIYLGPAQSRDSSSSPDSFFTVESLIRHEKYNDGIIVNPSNEFFDIAMLKLSREIPEPYIPARLPSSNLELGSGENLLISGFGKKLEFGRIVPSQKLRSAEVKVENGNLSPTHFSTRVVSSGVCDGDSGGPAYINDGHSLTLVGVTSFGDSRCSESNFFVAVSRFLNWIQYARISLGAGS